VRDNSSGVTARFKPLVDRLSANGKKIYGEFIAA
jgi:hypothetical protein